MSSTYPTNLPKVLAVCRTEEEVKAEFAKAFKFKLNTQKRMDLYTKRILFEFKFDKNFQQVQARASSVAQAIYYVRELKYGNSQLSIPPYICIVDKNEAFFIKTTSCKSIFDSSSEKFDWDRAPSTPCPFIVSATAKLASVLEAHVFKFGHAEDFTNFCTQLNHLSTEDPELDFSQYEKKIINEENFESAYSLWQTEFGAYVQDDKKVSEYFLSDIQKGKSHILPDSEEVAFDVGNNTLIKKPLPLTKYKNFWGQYEKCPDTRALHSIWQKVDRLTNEDLRRFTGEFYTPIAFAKKAIQYLEREVGERWWDSGYRLWDMAAGTGNLEYELPEEALPYTYISTLLEDDAKYCKALYPASTVFQYDYINDDVKLLFSDELDLLALGLAPKMPKKLYDELRDPNLKWLIFINPPFATANVAKTTGDLNKDGVSHTAIRSLMAKEHLGETSRELFSQFLFRISKEFAGKQAYLGMFSTLKYLNSNNDQKLRDRVFKYKFLRGFCLPSKAFKGNAGDFPIGFLIWDLAIQVPLADQEVTLDVYSIEADKIGSKEIPTIERDQLLSKWVDRPPNVQVRPPFSSAITLATDKKDPRDRVAKDFLCSLMVAGNDYQHQNNTYLLSGPAVSAGAYSVVPGNFDQSMVIHAVRLVINANWLNDRDQWFQPSKPLPKDFTNDCVIWSLFSSSNQTVAMDEVDYKGKTYPITNNLFPFTRAEIGSWPCSLSTLSSSIAGSDTERFAATWLKDRSLTPESEAVLAAAKVLYQIFFEHSSKLPWPQFKISKWDCGWYQIRRSLAEAGLASDTFSEFAAFHQKLGSKIATQLKDLGFVAGATRLFDE